MTKQPDFGSQLQELEAITAWFESDAVDLGEALAKFERGMTLADTLKRELEQMENRIETIKAKFDGPVSPEAGDSEPPADDPQLFA